MNRIETRINAWLATLVGASALAVIMLSAEEAITTGTDVAVWVVLAFAALLCGVALIWALGYVWYLSDLWSDLERDVFQEIDDLTVSQNRRHELAAAKIGEIDRRLETLKRRLADTEKAIENNTRAVA